MSDKSNKKKGIGTENYNKKPGKNEMSKHDEDFEAFEDYNHFVKATGWKTSNKVDQKQSNNKASQKLNKKPNHNKNDYRVDKKQNNSNVVSSNNSKVNSQKKNRNIVITDSRNSKKVDTRNIDTDNKNIDYARSKTNKEYSQNKIYSQNKASIKTENVKAIDRNIQSRQGEYQSKRGASEHHKDACPKRKECGGCNILRESYQEHLSEKQKSVEKLLKKYCKVEQILGMEKPEHYRNKVHVVFDHDRKGNPISGVYEEGTHKVVPVEKCLIHNEKADAIVATIRGMLKSFKILTYDEDTGYGLLRHVLIRTGYHSGEILVVLVLASPILPSKNNFVKALRNEHPEITTVVVNVNDKKTSMVLGDKEQIIYGRGYIEDTLCDKTFRISPKSFYQVNPRQTEVLYRKAVELAKLTGEETVVDAYCGIGTIGIIASEHAKKVIGVELNKDAVKDAVMNAKLNQIGNIEFYQKDAGIFLSQMAEVEATVDVVIMDPPRTGSNNQFMDALASIKPKKVVYISCNPVTLERDLEYLTKKGYKAEIAVPVDMFPWTGHVETVVLMSRAEK